MRDFFHDTNQVNRDRDFEFQNLLLPFAVFFFLMFCCVAALAEFIGEKYNKLYERPVWFIPSFVMIGVGSGWAYYTVGQWLFGG